MKKCCDAVILGFPGDPVPFISGDRWIDRDREIMVPQECQEEGMEIIGHHTGYRTASRNALQSECWAMIVSTTSGR